jgi:hypothetical protein
MGSRKQDSALARKANQDVVKALKRLPFFSKKNEISC